MICHKPSRPERRHACVGQGSSISRALVDQMLTSSTSTTLRLGDIGGMFNRKVFRKNIHSMVSSDVIQGAIQRASNYTIIFHPIGI